LEFFGESVLKPSSSPSTSKLCTLWQLRSHVLPLALLPARRALLSTRTTSTRATAVVRLLAQRAGTASCTSASWPMVQHLAATRAGSSCLGIYSYQGPSGLSSTGAFIHSASLHSVSRPFVHCTPGTAWGWGARRRGSGARPPGGRGPGRICYL